MRDGEKQMTLSERLAVLEKMMDENGKTIGRVFEALYGNGKPGLLSEFQTLRQSVEEHHEAVAEIRRRDRGNWQWVITTIVAIAAVVVAFFK